ncbi:MAG: hypothetical protein FJ405_15720 [Verrucomicrobia bacterium]|nr:hypothetical protein [Verrucomicrobiota bacterium]
MADPLISLQSLPSHGARPRTAGILGTPVSSGNRGVLALGASLINLCVEASNGGKATLLIGRNNNSPAPFLVNGQNELVPVIHCRLSPKAPLRDQLAWIVLMSLLYRVLPLKGLRRWICKSVPWIKAASELDVVGDIRGGDSFSDIYGMKRFLMGFLMAWSILLVRGTLVQFPQTYGPFKSPIARFLARFLLKRSNVIVARDLKSQKVAADLLGPDAQVLLSPDVAFSLRALRPETIECDPPLQGLPTSPVVGVNVNGLMFNGGYTRSNMFGLAMDYPAYLTKVIEALLAAHPGEVWLVPHTFAPKGDVESDPDASFKVRESLPEALRRRVRVITKDYDQNQIKGVIGLCDFFVGSRMHACIAALSQGIPCVGVAYSMKFAGVFESVGVEDWVIDGRTVDTDKAVARTLDLFAQRNAARTPLARKADEARSELRKVFRTIMDSPLPTDSHPMTEPAVASAAPRQLAVNE